MTRMSRIVNLFLIISLVSLMNRTNSQPAPTFGLITTIISPTNMPISSATFSPDGRFIAANTPFDGILVYSTLNFSLVNSNKINQNGQDTFGFEYTPDQTRIIDQ